MKKNKNLLAIGISAGALLLIYLLFRKNINKKLKESLGGYTWFEEGLDWYRSSSLRNGIDNLHPKFRKDVKELFSWIEKNTDYSVIWTSGYRSIPEQEKLHKQNPKNAKAGLSNHNYGFAFDINLRNKKTGEQLFKSSPKQKWLDTKIPQQAKSMGFKWGGDYAGYFDPVHFEKDGMPSTSQLLTLYKSGKIDEKGYVAV